MMKNQSILPPALDPFDILSNMHHHEPIVSEALNMAQRYTMTTKTRFSVALDEQEYAELAVMAEKHRVSMAWLVRHAVTEFLNHYGNEDSQLPLRLTVTHAERRSA